jgi:2-dehydro-3-deoxyphosphogluconate aldolase/(4S)-4-hydroxy-2-oxoglutarate aldolase
MISNILEKVYETGVIACIRKVDQRYLKDTLDALYSGGVCCVEIAMNTPGALSMIEKAKELYGDKMLFGAGTVLEEVTARNAILAGSDFILSPALNVKMIEVCNLYSKLAVPGAFTATEVLTAKLAGAQLIKVFPVTVMGPQYIKDLLGPLDDLNLLPMGGVSEKNAKDFIKAGAFALGIGSCLVNKSAVEKGDFEGIRTRAQEIIRQVKAGR